MVLAAGLGTRMQPLSGLLAKPALPVLNRPLLHHTLEVLARHGFRDVVVNTHHLPESVERTVGSGRRFGLRVRYSYEPNLLGSGGGPRRVREFFGDAPALLVNGDCVFDFDLSRLLRRHVESGARATLALKPNRDVRRYRPVVTESGGRVLSIRGLPKRKRGAVSLFTGVQVVDPALLEQLPPGSSDIVADLYLPLLAEGGHLAGLRVAGPWLDFGSPAFYLRSQLQLLAAAKGRSRSGSLIDAGVVMGLRARAIRSVVGARVHIGVEARVERSVLWPGSRVGEGARVAGSIVTAGARIAAGEHVRGQVVLPGARVPLR
ncbi:MAG TPA: NDP-sugar synthase [Vicinamibacteria bacterium]|nr:NDP-sugar synthase [Vicinamibacteria bacterium]